MSSETTVKIILAGMEARRKARIDTANAEEGPYSQERLEHYARGANSHLTDVEAAGTVRMLMRQDLDHEAVCTMARDRIMLLSQRVMELEHQLKVLNV